MKRSVGQVFESVDRFKQRVRRAIRKLPLNLFVGDANLALGIDIENRIVLELPTIVRLWHRAIRSGNRKPYQEPAGWTPIFQRRLSAAVVLVTGCAGTGIKQRAKTGRRRPVFQEQRLSNLERLEVVFAQVVVREREGVSPGEKNRRFTAK